MKILKVAAVAVLGVALGGCPDLSKECDVYASAHQFYIFAIAPFRPASAVQFEAAAAQEVAYWCSVGNQAKIKAAAEKAAAARAALQ